MYPVPRTNQRNFLRVGARAGSASKPGTATACEDINVAEAIVSGLTGAGIVAVVVDSGLELAHADLAQNIVPGGSHDFVGNDADLSSTIFDAAAIRRGICGRRGMCDPLEIEIEVMTRQGK